MRSTTHAMERRFIALVIGAMWVAAQSPGLAGQAGAPAEPRSLQARDEPGMVRVTVEVELSCPSCAMGLERRLNRLEHVAGVDVRPAEGQIVLAVEPGRCLDLAVVRDTVRNVGFVPPRRDGHRGRPPHRRGRYAGARAVASLHPAARRRDAGCSPHARGGRPAAEGERALERSAARPRPAAGRVVRGPLTLASTRAPTRGRRDSNRGQPSAVPVPATGAWPANRRRPTAAQTPSPRSPA